MDGREGRFFATLSTVLWLDSCVLAMAELSVSREGFGLVAGGVGWTERGSLRFDISSFDF